MTSTGRRPWCWKQLPARRAQLGALALRTDALCRWRWIHEFSANSRFTTWFSFAFQEGRAERLDAPNCGYGLRFKERWWFWRTRPVAFWPWPAGFPIP